MFTYLNYQTSISHASSRVPYISCHIANLYHKGNDIAVQCYWDAGIPNVLLASDFSRNM
ncbi:uncharacterized protein An07g00120 [Aspergillus niger]|uniref:Contig An07c0010, genomic contig n=2 Tax=Aspergillus niger TaxID=5061 RepID=A2QLY2_ASPNC|nr:uncharacterized protein An07g00120 [Aspergillus niger]CAK39236.1 unnamed protein product [Aspergillus niger]